MPNMPASQFNDQPSDSEQLSELADAVADLQAALTAQQRAVRLAQRQFRLLASITLALLGISLLIHALTISRLLSLRTTVRSQVGQLADAVQSAKQTHVRYELPINQQVPINLDVPIKRTLEVPIHTQVPIKQTLTVPIDTGLGKINIPIPLDLTVPIDLNVPITIDQTVNIDTSIPINMHVPIQIDLGASPFAEYLDKLHQAIVDLREQL